MIKSFTASVLACVCFVMASYGIARILNYIGSDAFNFFLGVGIVSGIVVGILAAVANSPASPNPKEEISKDNLLDKF